MTQFAILNLPTFNGSRGYFFVWKVLYLSQLFALARYMMPTCKREVVSIMRTFAGAVVVSGTVIGMIDIAIRSCRWSRSAAKPNLRPRRSTQVISSHSHACSEYIDTSYEHLHD